jgi:hypothetical protein
MPDLQPRLQKRHLSYYTPLLLLLVVCAYVYRSTLNGYFLADDFGYIHLYSRISLSRFRALFFNDWSQDIWGFNTGELRPFVGFTYWLEYRLWGIHPFGYHLSNLAMYLLAVAGFYLVALETARTFLHDVFDNTALYWITALGGALFLLHPSHVEAVAWIAGRTDLLGATAYIWSLFCLVRFWQTRSRAWAVAGIALYGAGLFIKENVVTMPAAFLLYAVLAGGAGRRRAQLAAVTGSLAVLAAFWVVCRRIAFGGIGNFSSTEFLGRIPYYARTVLPLSPSAAWLATGFLLLVLVTAVSVDWKRATPLVLFWGVGWPLLQALPLTGVHYDSPRHMFLVIAATSALLPALAAILWRKSRRLAGAIVGLCLVLAGFFWSRTVADLPRWELSSNYSRQLSELLQEQTFPEDSIVLFNSSPDLPVFFRQWTLPFAVEAPFLNLRARFVSKPDWYCCPSWTPKKESLLREVDGGTTQRVIRIDFDQATGRFVIR